jgi:hypothetical protein
VERNGGFIRGEAVEVTSQVNRLFKQEAVEGRLMLIVI